MKPINLNQISNEYIMRTKAGKLWRCGKGYRKNWAKLIGKLVLLHNAPYTLIDRIKEGGKWYLVFTDGTNNYTERQDKALHNKKLAKDTIIEAAKRVIAGLLLAPMELIDRLVKEVDKFNEQHNIPTSQVAINMGFKMSFNDKLRHIRMACKRGWRPLRQVRNELLQYYHPDHYTGQNQPQLNLLYNL